MFVLKTDMYIFSSRIYKRRLSSSFQLHNMVARYPTHISDELEPNKGVVMDK